MRGNSEEGEVPVGIQVQTNSPIITSKPRALDLFSGTGSVGARLRELGYEVTSLDADRRRKPDILVDILSWDYKDKYTPGYFHVIAAGVPCTEYSPAKTFGQRRLDYADRLVERTLEIIAYFQPPVWWIENPRLGLLETREIMRGIPYIDVDYCQFGDWGYKKPTRIWCCDALAKLPNKLCPGASCPNFHEGVGDTGIIWEGITCNIPHCRNAEHPRNWLTLDDRYRCLHRY